jgi:hypothetical protein
VESSDEHGKEIQFSLNYLEFYLLAEPLVTSQRGRFSMQMVISAVICFDTAMTL